MKPSLVPVVVGAALAVNCSYAVAQQDDELATLDAIEGETMISRNGRYVDGVEGMRLVDGQRVMAVNLDAVIQFDDGCRYVLEEGRLLVIEKRSPCALGIPPEASSAGLAWAPPAFAATVGVLGAVLPTGSDDRDDDLSQRRPISP
jgi:hypothetical protein